MKDWLISWLSRTDNQIFLLAAAIIAMGGWLFTLSWHVFMVLGGG